MSGDELGLESSQIQREGSADGKKISKIVCFWAPSIENQKLHNLLKNQPPTLISRGETKGLSFFNQTLEQLQSLKSGARLFLKSNSRVGVSYFEKIEPGSRARTSYLTKKELNSEARALHFERMEPGSRAGTVHVEKTKLGSKVTAKSFERTEPLLQARTGALRIEILSSWAVAFIKKTEALVPCFLTSKKKRFQTYLPSKFK